MTYLLANLDTFRKWWVFFAQNDPEANNFIEKMRVKKWPSCSKDRKPFNTVGDVVSILFQISLLQYNTHSRLKHQKQWEELKNTHFVYNDCPKSSKKIEKYRNMSKCEKTFYWLFICFWGEDGKLPKCIFELLSLFLFHKLFLFFIFDFIVIPIFGQTTHSCIVVSSNSH